VTHAYTYDPLNRLTQMGSSKNSSAISNYAYTLGAAGNRTAVTELSGGNVSYGYDSLYRLTSETVSADPNNKNGAISYTYDNVGNRKMLTSTLAPVGGNTYNYDADDRLAADSYDLPHHGLVSSVCTTQRGHQIKVGGFTRTDSRYCFSMVSVICLWSAQGGDSLIKVRTAVGKCS